LPEINKLIKTHQEQKKKEIDWQSLIYELDDLDAKILKLFYYPKPTCFILDELVRRCRTSNASKITIWRRVNKLADLKLIVKIDKTKPLAMQSNLAISYGNVIKLIKLLCGRYGLERINNVR